MKASWGLGVCALTQSEDIVDLTTIGARASRAKVAAKVLISARVVVVAADDSLGEAGVRGVGEDTGLNGPAEAFVQVQLGPHLVAIGKLELGLEEHLAALPAVEVGQGNLRAGVKEATGKVARGGRLLIPAKPRRYL